MALKMDDIGFGWEDESVPDLGSDYEDSYTAEFQPDDDDGDENERSDIISKASSAGEDLQSGLHLRWLQRKKHFPLGDRKLECPEDEEYLDYEAWGDRYVLANPNGVKQVYPQIFVPIASTNEWFCSPEGEQEDAFHILRLPTELRLQILYTYFLPDHSWDEKTPLRFCSHKEECCDDCHWWKVGELKIQSENRPLKYWLTDSIFRVSRQIRSEALSSFFESTTVQIDWLPNLPRFINFIGCFQGSIRKLVITDPLFPECWNSDFMVTAISSIGKLRNLKELNFWISDLCMRKRDNESLDNTLGLATRSQILARPEMKALEALRVKSFQSRLDPSFSTDISDSAYSGNTAHAAWPQVLRKLEETLRQSIQQPRSNEVVKDEKPPDSDSKFNLANLCNDAPVVGNPSASDNDNCLSIWNFYQTRFQEHIAEGIQPWISVSEGDEIGHFLELGSCPFASVGLPLSNCAMCFALQKHCGYHGTPPESMFNNHAEDRTQLDWASITESVVWFLIRHDDLVRQQIVALHVYLTEGALSNTREAVKPWEHFVDALMETA